MDGNTWPVFPGGGRVVSVSSGDPAPDFVRSSALNYSRAPPGGALWWSRRVAIGPLLVPTDYVHKQSGRTIDCILKRVAHDL